MQTQTDFDFDAHKHARHSDLDTSHAAAASMKVAAQILCVQILAHLVSDGPQTFDEVSFHLKIPAARVWKRLSDLKNHGYIEPSGITRPGISGRAQTVWRVKR